MSLNHHMLPPLASVTSYIILNPTNSSGLTLVQPADQWNERIWILYSNSSGDGKWCIRIAIIMMFGMNLPPLAPLLS